MTDRRRAVRAIEIEMAARQWTIGDLAARAGVDRDTVSDLLSGRRWPQRGTQGRIELALGWGAGRISALCDGLDVPAVTHVDELRVRRPSGLSDEDWWRVRHAVEDAITAALRRIASVKSQGSC